MQQRALIVLALFALCTTALSSFNNLDAVSEARVFWRKHAGKPPRGDELAELNRQNPEAYAIVKALLTKRSLGLLNPMHPTASFAAPSGGQQLQAAEQGPEVFAKFASGSYVDQEPLAPRVAVPYAEVQAPAHRDWLNWKAQDSGANDEQMVQNVLGAVSSLNGAKKSGLLSKQHNYYSTTYNKGSLSVEEDDDDDDEADKAELAAADPKTVVLAAPPAAPAKSHHKNIDAPVTKPMQKLAAPVKHENSYSKNVHLRGDRPQVVALAPVKKKKIAHFQHSSENYLDSFSWDESKPKPKVVKKPETKKENLMAWLGVVQKAPAPKVAPPKAKAPIPEAPKNRYLSDLD